MAAYSLSEKTEVKTAVIFCQFCLEKRVGFIYELRGHLVVGSFITFDSNGSVGCVLDWT